MGPWYVNDLRASGLKKLGWDGEFIDRILITSKDTEEFLVSGGKDSIVARISLDNRPDGELLNETHLADAYLMAAAPDMYEALEQLLDDMRDGLSVCEDAKEQAIAAVRKAKGEK